MILSTQQAAEWLHTHRHRVDDLRYYGLLYAIKLDRGYGYDTRELERFVDWAQGKDLSSREKIRHWAKKKGTGDLVREPMPNE